MSSSYKVFGLGLGFILKNGIKNRFYFCINSHIFSVQFLQWFLSWFFQVKYNNSFIYEKHVCIYMSVHFFGLCSEGITINVITVLGSWCVEPRLDESVASSLTLCHSSIISVVSDHVEAKVMLRVLLQWGVLPSRVKQLQSRRFLLHPLPDFTETWTESLPRGQGKRQAFPHCSASDVCQAPVSQRLCCGPGGPRRTQRAPETRPTGPKWAQWDVSGRRAAVAGDPAQDGGPARFSPCRHRWRRSKGWNKPAFQGQRLWKEMPVPQVKGVCFVFGQGGRN